MLRRFLLARGVVLAALLVVPLFAGSGFNLYELGTLDAVETGSAVKVISRGDPAETLTLSVITTGSPVTATLKIEGSIDGTNYFDLSGDIDASASVMFHIVDRPVTHLRARLSALSGGTSPTVTITALAKYQ